MRKIVNQKPRSHVTYQLVWASSQDEVHLFVVTANRDGGTRCYSWTWTAAKLLPPSHFWRSRDDSAAWLRYIGYCRRHDSAGKSWCDDRVHYLPCCRRRGVFGQRDCGNCCRGTPDQLYLPEMPKNHPGDCGILASVSNFICDAASIWLTNNRGRANRGRRFLWRARRYFIKHNQRERISGSQYYGGGYHSDG
jgi:hypothetical protein